MKNKIGYSCKYTPIELLVALGASPVLFNAEAADFDYAQRVSHLNLCSQMKALLENLHGGDLREMLLTTCCDSGRRVYDILQAESAGRCASKKMAADDDSAAAEEDADFLFLLDLPHVAGEAARHHFKAELLRLIEEYGKYSGQAFDEERFRRACAETAETAGVGSTVAANAEHTAAGTGAEQSSAAANDRPPEKFIGVLGARVSDGLLEKLQAQSPIPVVNLTCNSNRAVGVPPETLRGDLDGLMDWYAGQLLSQLPCMRMADIRARKDLLTLPGLCGIIYHTVKFCDYYGFEYETVRHESKLPILKIETDFTLQSLGQLSTRIDGFLESMGLTPSSNHDGKCRSNDRPQTPGAQGAHDGKNAPSPDRDSLSGDAFYVGIDSGSTTTNVAVLDAQGNLVDSAIVRTGAKAQRGAEKAFDALSIPREHIAYIVATGYGRNNISFANEAITEITCHARGASSIAPNARTIIDIGGQDCKAISLDERGNVKNFAMNDKCAAGTGRFLENMAKVLETDLDGMSTVGLTWKEDLTISSMCTVFAESEVVSLIADNKSIGDIVHGLNKSVAAKAMTLVGRVGAESRYMMTGGGARNKGVVQCIEALLGEKLIVPETPDLCGAIGAALFALERGRR